MDGHSGDEGCDSLESVCEGFGEENVGPFALSVGPPRAVRAALPIVQIAGIHISEAVSCRSQDHYSRRRLLVDHLFQ